MICPRFLELGLGLGFEFVSGLGSGWVWVYVQDRNGPTVCRAVWCCTIYFAGPLALLHVILRSVVLVVLNLQPRISGAAQPEGACIHRAQNGTQESQTTTK